MKEIINSDNYFITSDGCVFDSDKNQVQSWMSPYGFKVVKVAYKGVKKIKQLNILVASHFIPNPSKYRRVKHIDNDRTNCNASNLEWISNKENYKRHKKAETKKPIQVDCFDLDGNFIKRFFSVREASLYLKIPQPNIVTHLKGRTKRVGNYIFRKS